MATTATLTALRASALDLADLTNSSSPVTAQLDTYINQAIAELHDILVNSFEDYYLTVSPISLSPGVSEYPLPADFYKALKVFAVQGTNERYRMRRFQLDELETYLNRYNPLCHEVCNLAYRIMGSKIRLVPDPITSGTVELWYAPGATVLVNAGDSLTVSAPIAWWEEFVALSAAVKLRVREESDASQLMALREQCRQRIMRAAEERDAGEPQRITDLEHRFIRRYPRLFYR